MTIRLMNSAMMPQAGNYWLKKITAGEFAVALNSGESWKSYVGYAATAKHIEALTGQHIPVSREQTLLQDGDTILVCKLKYRLADPTTKGDPGRVPEAEDYEYFSCLYYC